VWFSSETQNTFIWAKQNQRFYEEVALKQRCIMMGTAVMQTAWGFSIV
jgi:hypothetical protein